MNRGSDQVKQDPGDDSVILRAYLHWHESPMSLTLGGGWGRVVRNTDEWILLANVPRDRRRQHHFIPVDVGDEHRNDRWHLIRLGPGVWDISPSVVVPGQLHAFLTLVDVPEPAPWSSAQ